MLVASVYDLEEQVGLLPPGVSRRLRYVLGYALGSVRVSPPRVFEYGDVPTGRV